MLLLPDLAKRDTNQAHPWKALAESAVDSSVLSTSLPQLNLRKPDLEMDTDEESTTRVLFVATSLGEGGIERLSLTMASGLLVNHNIEVAFVCSPGSYLEKNAQACGIRTEPLTLRNSGDIRAMRQLAEHIIKFNADIVHVHSRRDYVPAAVAMHMVRARIRRESRAHELSTDTHATPLGLDGSQSQRGPRLLIHSHLDKPLGMPRCLARRLFSSCADAVITVSDAVKDRLVAVHGFAPSFVRVLHNGIDLDNFLLAGSKLAKQSRLATRKELSIPPDALVIGVVGRLNAKGQADLLNGAGPLLRQHRSLWIVMVGPDGEPGDMERLREEATAQGIAAHVVLTGARDDIPELLPAFDVLVQLPKSESFGLALVEAMASGLPTITTDVGGCSEVVVNESTGLIVPHGDQSKLQEALKRLLYAPDAAVQRITMGLEGRKVACSRFSIDRQVENLANWYADLAAVRL